jgi:cytochrome c
MIDRSVAIPPLQRHATVTFFIFLCFGIAVITPRLSRGAQVAEPNSHALTDAEQGKRLFEKRCGGCHALDHDQTGPRLGTVYGRKAGTISTFRYSTAVKSAKITWDDVLLDRWLTDTDSLIPGNEMDFSVPKADERAAIIRFLRLSSGK